MERLIDVPTSAPEKLPPDPISEMAYALTDPLIVFPGGGWEETIPENLKALVTPHRLAHLMRCFRGQAQWDEATDLEALIYLYPASLAAPMAENWARIYLHLGTKVMGERFPQEIRQGTLNDYDLEELRRLKQWIYRQRKKARQKPPAKDHRWQQAKFEF